MATCTPFATLTRLTINAAYTCTVQTCAYHDVSRPSNFEFAANDGNANINYPNCKNGYCKTNYGLSSGNVQACCDGVTLNTIRWAGTAPSCTRIVCTRTKNANSVWVGGSCSVQEWVGDVSCSGVRRRTIIVCRIFVFARLGGQKSKSIANRLLLD